MSYILLHYTVQFAHSAKSTDGAPYRQFNGIAVFDLILSILYYYIMYGMTAAVHSEKDHPFRYTIISVCVISSNI